MHSCTCGRYSPCDRITCDFTFSVLREQDRIRQQEAREAEKRLEAQRRTNQKSESFTNTYSEPTYSFSGSSSSFTEPTKSTYTSESYSTYTPSGAGYIPPSGQNTATTPLTRRQKLILAGAFTVATAIGLSIFAEENDIIPPSTRINFQGTIVKAIVADGSKKTIWAINPECDVRKNCPELQTTQSGITLNNSPGIPAITAYGINAGSCVSSASLGVTSPGNPWQISVVASSQSVEASQNQVEKICSAWLDSGLSACQPKITTLCSDGREIQKVFNNNQITRYEDLCVIPGMEGYCTIKDRSENPLPAPQTP